MRGLRARLGVGGLLVVSLAIASAAHAQSESALTLADVMQRFATSGGVEARFHESRQLAILNDPIESSGMLYFAPPDWLARHVTQPGESKVVVRDDRVTFRDETGVQTLELDSSEVARAVVGNTMVLMRGDLELLNEQYEATFRVQGSGEAGAAGALWTLDLTPRGRVVRKIIERLRVQGRGGKLVRMESLETSGDVTVTTFSEVKVGVEFSDAAREEIFSIAPVSVPVPAPAP